MMADIYDQHEAAFSKVNAYVILDAHNQLCATIAFKYPKDGAGRLYVYVHWIGLEMKRGHAIGYGYDKASAATAVAASAIAIEVNKLRREHKPIPVRVEDFVTALYKDDDTYWYQHLMNAGFKVLKAV